MSYRMEYVPSIDKYEIVKNKNRNTPFFLFMITLGFLFTMLLWRDGREAVRSFLIPGEDSVTVLALQTMADDLRSGAGLYEAIFDFCHMVIHGV